MSELYPSAITYIRQEVQHRENVFGTERMAAIKGNLASAETTLQFGNFIEVLCNDSDAYHRYRGRARGLPQFPADPLLLTSNPGGYELIDANEAERSRAALDNYSHERRVMKPRKYPLGIYDIKESIYIDAQNEHAMVQRSLQGIVTLGRRVTTFATKRATEQEVSQAFDMIFNAYLDNQVPFQARKN